jgi:hypothetical protein
MADNRRAPKAKKAELQQALAKSNTAWAAATAIVMSHNGFDANGHIVDKAAAQQSVKDLARTLGRYIGSLRSLKALIRQFNLQI